MEKRPQIKGKVIPGIGWFAISFEEFVRYYGGRANTGTNGWELTPIQTTVSKERIKAIRKWHKEHPKEKGK